MGTIEHREILMAQGNDLAVTMDWVKPGGKTLLLEDTRFVFQAEPNLRIIDRITTLTALDERAVFNDTKEGMTGLRVTRALEHPTDEPLRLTNASGVATEVPIMDNDGVKGAYLTSRRPHRPRRLGRPCPVGRPPWRNRRGSSDRRDLRPPGEPGQSDLLACPHLRAFHRQSLRAAYVYRWG
ncbi:MAG: PmoA family protein [Candidatus Marinimicrobia bacterium]|nr:PmoA family protein [Candidatus Neomarinimicrobiota bacterium]